MIASSPIVRSALGALVLLAAATTGSVAKEQVFDRRADGFQIQLAGGFALGGEQENLFVFGSNTTPGLVIVMSTPGLSWDDIEAAKKAGYHDEGVSLTPSGPAKDVTVPKGRGAVLEVSGVLDGAQVQGLLAGYVGESGQGLVLLAATTPDQWANLEPTARAISGGVRMIKIDAAPVIAEWKQYLTGMKLTYMHTSGDYTGGIHDEEHFFLCSDGSFLFQDKSDMSLDIDAGFGYSHSKGGGSGSWEIRAVGGQPHIVFSFQDGTARSHVLTNEGSKTFLDGYRYFVVENPHCR